MTGNQGEVSVSFLKGREGGWEGITHHVVLSMSRINIHPVKKKGMKEIGRQIILLVKFKNESKLCENI
jgi:hypothetical protein